MSTSCAYTATSISATARTPGLTIRAFALVCDAETFTQGTSTITRPWKQHRANLRFSHAGWVEKLPGGIEHSFHDTFAYTVTDVIDHATRFPLAGGEQVLAHAATHCWTRTKKLAPVDTLALPSPGFVVRGVPGTTIFSVLP